MFVPFSEVEHHEKDYFLDPLTKTAMAKEQLKWLIKKGDLILSDEPKEVRAGPIDFNFTENSSRRGTIPIYSYDGKDTPDRLAIYESGELKSMNSFLRRATETDFCRFDQVSCHPLRFERHPDTRVSTLQSCR